MRVLRTSGLAARPSRIGRAAPPTASGGTVARGLALAMLFGGTTAFLPAAHGQGVEYEESLTGETYSVEDATWTLRLADFRALTLSETNPDVGYLASFNGYVFVTEDGGKTWDESRLIPDRRSYFGDEGQSLYFGWQRETAGSEVPGHRTGSRIDAVLPRGGSTPVSRENVVGYSGIEVGGGDRVSEAANRAVGIGLPGRAPWLQRTVRKFGKVTSGLNIKQTLLLRGVMDAQIRYVVIHPHNPNIAYACTYFGLYMTENRGLTWVRTFVGDGPLSTRVYHAAVDPVGGSTVLLASGDGMFISTDGGRNFMKSPAQGVGNGSINWIYFNPYDARFVFAATNYGLLRSSDRGQNWEWIYFTSFPPARVIRYVTIDPHDKQTGYIATHDGPFTISNILTGGLEDWRRVWPLGFTGYSINKIDVDPQRKGHMWAMTIMKLPQPHVPGEEPTGGSFVWESVDGGETWQVIFSGNHRGRLAWYTIDPSNSDRLWMIWNRSITKMTRVTAKDIAQEQPSPEKAEKLRALLNADTMPTLTDAQMAMLLFLGQESERVLNYRRGARLKALVPRLDLSVAGFRMRGHGVLVDAIYAPVLPYRQQDYSTLNGIEFRAMLTWDLRDLVYSSHRPYFGRVARGQAQIRGIIEWFSGRFYGELRRLRAMMITNPPKELYVRLHYETRIEELESMLNYQSGGYLQRYKRGDRPDPRDTKWFKRWPGTGPDFPVN